MSSLRYSHNVQLSTMWIRLFYWKYYNCKKTKLICLRLQQWTKPNNTTCMFILITGVGKWVPASAGKAKAGMVHSVSGWTRGVQVKLWDLLRTCAIPKRLRDVFTTRRYTNPRLPYLTSLPYFSKLSKQSCTYCSRLLFFCMLSTFAIRAKPLAEDQCLYSMCVF